MVGEREALAKVSAALMHDARLAELRESMSRAAVVIFAAELEVETENIEVIL